MTGPQRINVTIDSLVVDGPVDESALRAAIAAELGSGASGKEHTRPGSVEARAARAVASRVQHALPSDPGAPRL